MATRNIRINISVDEDLNELLVELAKYQGVPKATLVTNYLMYLKPYLQHLSDIQRQLEKHKDPTAYLKDMLNEGYSILDGLKVDIEDD